MTAIIILNVVLSATVLFGIVGMLAWSLYTDNADATPDHPRTPRAASPRRSGLRSASENLGQ